VNGERKGERERERREEMEKTRERERDRGTENKGENSIHTYNLRDDALARKKGVVLKCHISLLLLFF